LYFLIFSLEACWRHIPTVFNVVLWCRPLPLLHKETWWLKTRQIVRWNLSALGSGRESRGFSRQPEWRRRELFSGPAAQLPWTDDYSSLLKVII